MTTVVLSPTSAATTSSPSNGSTGGDVSACCHSSNNQENQEINQRESVTKDASSANMLRIASKKRPRVVFEAAEIVEFEPTVHTTSVTSGGVPVGMSLKERSRVRRRLDSFEMERKNFRVGRQNYMEEGYLDPEEREYILNNAGCEEEIITKVEEEVNRIIAHRRESNEIDFEYLCGLGGMSVELEEDDDEDDEEIDINVSMDDDDDSKCCDSSLDDSIVNELLEQEEQEEREAQKARENGEDKAPEMPESETEPTSVMEVLVSKPEPKAVGGASIPTESVVSPV